MAISYARLSKYVRVSFNIRPMRGCFCLKMLLFCCGHSCIYESFCCHMLICTILVFDIANYCPSSDGKRLSNLKQAITTILLNPWGVPDREGQVLFPIPTHPLQPPPALRAGRYKKASWGKSCLNCNCHMHCAEVFPFTHFFSVTSRQCMERFSFPEVSFFFRSLDLDVPCLESFQSQSDGII